MSPTVAFRRLLAELFAPGATLGHPSFQAFWTVVVRRSHGPHECSYTPPRMVVTSAVPVLPPDPDLLTPALERTFRGHRAAVLSVGISTSLGQVGTRGQRVL